MMAVPAVGVGVGVGGREEGGEDTLPALVLCVHVSYLLSLPSYVCFLRTKIRENERLYNVVGRQGKFCGWQLVHALRLTIVYVVKCYLFPCCLQIQPKVYLYISVCKSDYLLLRFRKGVDGALFVLVHLFVISHMHNTHHARPSNFLSAWRKEKRRRAQASSDSSDGLEGRKSLWKLNFPSGWGSIDQRIFSVDGSVGGRPGSKGYY